MQAIIDKYGFKEGLTTKNGKIVDWPYEGIPRPGVKALAKIISDYNNKIRYKKDRKREYPTIEDQLDLIYHDKINGSNKWETLITSIKTKYPKPE